MEFVDVKKVARNARIHLEKERLQEFQERLDSMVKWFREMLEISVEEKIAQVYSTTALTEERNCFNDEISKPETREAVLFNVPERKENLILVPKVL